MTHGVTHTAAAVAVDGSCCLQLLHPCCCMHAPAGLKLLVTARKADYGVGGAGIACKGM